jgi:hypothetical protein
MLTDRGHTQRTALKVGAQRNDVGTGAADVGAPVRCVGPGNAGEYMTHFQVAVVALLLLLVVLSCFVLAYLNELRIQQHDAFKASEVHEAARSLRATARAMRQSERDAERGARAERAEAARTVARRMEAAERGQRRKAKKAERDAQTAAMEQLARDVQAALVVLLAYARHVIPEVCEVVAAAVPAPEVPDSEPGRPTVDLLLRRNNRARASPSNVALMSGAYVRSCRRPGAVCQGPEVIIRLPAQGGAGGFCS